MFDFSTVRPDFIRATSPKDLRWLTHSGKSELAERVGVQNMSVVIRIAMQMMTIQIPSDISMQISVGCQKS